MQLLIFLKDKRFQTKNTLQKVKLAISIWWSSFIINDIII